MGRSGHGTIGRGEGRAARGSFLSMLSTCCVMAGIKGKPVSERPIWLWPLLGFLLPVGVGGVFLVFQWRQWAQTPGITQQAPRTMERTPSPPITEPVGFTPGLKDGPQMNTVRVLAWRANNGRSWQENALLICAEGKLVIWAVWSPTALRPKSLGNG